MKRSGLWVVLCLCVLPGAAQDGAGKKPTIGRVCPEEFLASYLQTFVVIGDGFQPGATTVKVNGEAVSDVTVLSSTRLIFTTSLSPGANNVEIGTPGGSTEPRPVLGVQDLTIGQLTHCVTDVLKFFAGLNPPEVHNNVLTPVSQLMESVAKLAAEGKFTPTINQAGKAMRKVDVGVEHGDITQRAGAAVTTILTVLLTTLNDLRSPKKQDKTDKCVTIILIFQYGTQTPGLGGAIEPGSEPDSFMLESGKALKKQLEEAGETVDVGTVGKNDKFEKVLDDLMDKLKKADKNSCLCKLHILGHGNKKGGLLFL